MNALAKTFAAVTDTLQRATAPQPSVNVTLGILDFAGQNASKIGKIGRAASNITEAVYVRSPRYVTLEELDLLAGLVASLKEQLILEQAGIVRLDAEMDHQFSRDESDYRDRERA